MVLQKMRAGAQGVVAKVVVGLIVFVLAVTGFGAIQFFSGGEPVAATVNGDDITQRTLDVETQRRRVAQRSQLGGEVSDEVLDRMVNREAVLQSLIVRKLVDQFADELDLSIADQLVQARIRESFAGLAGFDEGAYRSYLASIGHTPSSYRAEQAGFEIQNRLSSSVGDTSIVTNRELRRSARILRQRRDIAYLLFDIESFASSIEVGDAEIEGHYGANLDDYMTEERFDFDVVRFPRSTLEADVEVDEEAVALAYQDEVAAKAEPRRRAAHVLLEVTGERSVEDAFGVLAELRAEVEGGANFEERAAELSEDPASAANGGDLGMVDRGVYPPAFEEALWALEPGGLSQPVETEFGAHLIKLIEVEQVEIPAFEERRDEIVADLRRDEVDQRFTDEVREMDLIAYEQSDSLDGLTATYGLDVEPLDGVTRASREGVLAIASVREAAFSDDVVVEGFNSGAVATADAVVVVRLRSRHPPTEKPLDQVREEIRDQLARARGREMAEEAAYDALARFADGATPSEVATVVEREWQRADAVERTDPTVPEAILALAFEMTAPVEGERQSDITTLADGSRALVLLSNVSLADYDALPEAERRQVAMSLKQLTASQDLGALVRTLRADASISSIDFGTDGP